MVKNRGDRGLVELDLGDAEEADGQQEVVHRADDRADRELPLEAEPQIGEDREDGDHDAERPALDKLGGDGRADRIDAAELIVGAKGVLDLGDCGLLAGVAAWLHAETQQHVGFGADPLHFDGANAKSLALRANVGDIGLTALGAHVDLSAAREVDAEIHAHEQEHEDRYDRQ